ncbi:efflux RND transporter permease subunit [Lederbergia galactosidilytica]|uniref:Cation transporter n=1 Tax=Lederbergia galactosidilytica TaxID=217031 RepID=A0A177ZJB3_9BACI|nr:efflux RND transporter permease subunit [Lederbergia galactosidilytica]KRG15996.1 cation transporter [Virgibacillus soli]OAK67693.1 cation transporter [Lederbergia galactosidilytica]
MNISRFSIRRPIFTIVTMCLIIFLGIVSLVKIPLTLIPNINPPIAVVVTSYQGASPDEVVEKVTKPLEATLSTLPGIKNVRSFSEEGSSLVLLEFSWSTSIDAIQNDVLQRIDMTPVPKDAARPKFMKFDPSQFPVIQLSLQTGRDADIQTLTDDLVDELEKVEGVANVNVSGTVVEEVRVILDQNKIKKYRLAQSDIVQAIQANQISLPGDTVLSEGQELTTRVLSIFYSPEEIANIPVTRDPRTGDKILIKDVAEVKKQPQRSTSITRANQQSSVLLSVLQESDANTASVSKAFQQKLNDQLQREQFKQVQSNILFDQGEYIKIAIGNIASSLIVGGLLAMIVLFLFLRNFKSPLIVGVAIPYSVIVTFVLMYFADFAFNIMTLGGLALGVGMLVDNAIVVIENIYRHLSMGKNPKVAAEEGAKEVAGAITASTLTTVAVFLPVVFISGILGDLFKEFAFTISFSLLASLFVALTVIPMFASRWLKTPKGNYEAKRRRSKSLNMLDRSIRWALRHRIVVLFLAIIFFIGGIAGLRTLGTQFLPPTDEGFFRINIQLENGAALKKTEEIVSKVERELNKEDDVEVYVSLIGSTQEASFQGEGKANTAEMYVKLKPLAERTQTLFEFVDTVKPKIKKEVQQINPSAILNFNVEAASGLAPQTLTFNVHDTNKERLERDTKKIYDALNKLEYVTELKLSTADSSEEIQIKIDQNKAFDLGLAPASIATIVHDMTRGVQASQMVTENSEVFEIFVSLDESITRDVDELKDLQIRKPDGTYVKLGDLATIDIGEGPVEIQRINQQDAVHFTVKYNANTDLGTVTKAANKIISDLNLSDDTQISYSGEQELLQESKTDMIMALILAIILIYLVMAAQFESFKYPFVIMFTVPLMVVGIAISMFVTHLPMSIPAFIGVIILAGIVVNNAIVIVDYINQKKEQGMSSVEALVESVKDRARPIFMTALTTILGLVPIALGLGEGTELNQPMGVTVIGGLLSSTLLTLIVIPVVYSLFDSETRKMNKKAREK